MLFATPPEFRAVLASPRTDLLLLIALLAASAWAGWRSSKLELDVENRSMRSTGRDEARADEERERLFGHDATLVLLLEAGAPEEADGAALDGWVDGLRQRAVDQCLVLPGGESERLVALTLGRDASGGVAGSLEDVVEAARSSAPPAHVLRVSGTPAGEAAIASALDEEQRRIVPLVGAVL